VVGASALAVGVFAPVASAHVTIDTLGDVQAGGFAKLGVSVPNERPDAGTVKVSLQLDQNHPLPFLSVEPKAGWEITTTTRRLGKPASAEGESISEVVDTVTWTATGDTQIGPGQFDQFWLSVGPIPDDATELVFKAIQTYSSGEEVAWVEPTPAGGEEPDHPAPTVSVVPAVGAAVSSGGDRSDTLATAALIVGIVGLIAGGTGVAIAAHARNKKVAPTS
jgi:periplasmic copper chaperone A